MTCRDVEARLSAYLDGELDATASSALRGHLRTCAACNAVAEDHAKIAGALAGLHEQPIEPPAALWDGVLARLGEAEKADAQRSRWSLAARSLWQRLRWQLLPVTAVAAAAVVAVVWWSQHDRAPSTVADAPILRAPIAPELAPPEALPPEPTPDVVPEPKVDVETSLAAEALRIDALYTEVVAELTAEALVERATWPASQQRAFDAQITRLRAAVSARPLVTAPLDPDGDGGTEARERAWQKLAAYLQRAVLGELIAEAR